MNESPDEVRSLVRGLEILKALNAAGSLRPGALARRIGLARPTAYRLLETLEECGFVAKSASDERYRITERAARLFARYEAAQAIGTSARAAFDDAARRCPWLLHLSAYEHGAMVVRMASRSTIPLVPARGYVGRLLPLLESAAGKAYLASCGSERRQAALRQGGLDGPVDDILAEASSAGCATRDDEFGDPPTASTAVALNCGGHTVGALTAVYIRSAPNETTTALPAFLRDEADIIGRHLTSAC